MKKLSVYLFVTHIGISLVFFGIILYLFRIQRINDTALIDLLLFLMLVWGYFYSGYRFTNKKVNWYYYFPVTAIGLLLCGIICIIEYSETEPYKLVGRPGKWAFYELFIPLKIPLDRIDFVSSQIIHYFLSFIMPVVISCIQWAGGRYKLKQQNLRS